jgi:hypothetical protein
VAGTYKTDDGRTIQVAALSNEDRRTIIRWIDLGCPIDAGFDPEHPSERGYGWMADDNRPTLTLSEPQPGANRPLARLLIGMHDYYSGLAADSLEVTADFAVDDAAPGTNLASRFKPLSSGVWELKLAKPIEQLERGRLNVTIADRQGNKTRVERSFTVGR